MAFKNIQDARAYATHHYFRVFFSFSVKDKIDDLDIFLRYNGLNKILTPEEIVRIRARKEAYEKFYVKWVIPKKGGDAIRTFLEFVDNAAQELQEILLFASPYDYLLIKRAIDEKTPEIWREHLLGISEKLTSMEMFG